MDSSSLRRLKRVRSLDRFMAWLISAGGVLIIAAVLGILVFITKEALPLFRSAKIRELQSNAVPASDAVFLDESGKYAATFSSGEGLHYRSLEQQYDVVIAGSKDQPPLPWKRVFSNSARGRAVVQGSDNSVYAAELQWNQGENGPEVRVEWTGPFYATANDNLMAAKLVSRSGLRNRQFLKMAALEADSIRIGEADPGSPAEWTTWRLPQNLTPNVARWSEDGATLYVGTQQGELIAYGADGELLRSEFGEPVTALGFAFGYKSLLVGGGEGKLAAYQIIRRDGKAELQRFHDFAPLGGSVRGFMESLRDKRFLAWSDINLAVTHLTTEKQLTSVPAEIKGALALSPKGDNILVTGQPTLRWHLQAFHTEVSWSLFWKKIHYEGYAAPEYVWQSGGATDDIEPKLSLVPLLFGTFKGTFYAMLFALPIAVFAALYTSQFASPKFRETIKPTVEIMAALPSVVLGFVAGLVLAPLLEQWMIALLVVIPVAITIIFLLMLAWSRIPTSYRDKYGKGKEALWLIPVIFLALVVSVWMAPWIEKIFFGGDYRHWLYQGKGIVYDQRNSIVVGFAMGFAVIPIIFSISEDAFTAVPKSLASASLACGASPWQTAWRVIVPTASPGVFSAVMVGLGRAIGETMIVLMATGNTPIMDWGPFNGMRTLSANIAVEIPEAPHQGTLYRVLFFTALLLFSLTFILNTAAELIRQSLRKRYESM